MVYIYIYVYIQAQAARVRRSDPGYRHRADRPTRDARREQGRPGDTALAAGEAARETASLDCRFCACAPSFAGSGAASGAARLPEEKHDGLGGANQGVVRERLRSGFEV